MGLPERLDAVLTWNDLIRAAQKCEYRGRRAAETRQFSMNIHEGALAYRQTSATFPILLRLCCLLSVLLQHRFNLSALFLARKLPPPTPTPPLPPLPQPHLAHLDPSAPLKCFLLTNQSEAISVKTEPSRSGSGLSTQAFKLCLGIAFQKQAIWLAKYFSPPPPPPTCMPDGVLRPVRFVCVSRVCLRVCAFDLDLVSLNCRIFLDTVNVINIKSCIMLAFIELYSLIPFWYTLTLFLR